MPCSKGRKSLTKLKIVYGAMPIKLSAEYKEVEQYIRHLVSKSEAKDSGRTRT